MKRYLTVGIIFGVLVVSIVIISWFGFPAWHDPASGGFWTLLGATAIGVLAFLQGMVSIWKDLKEEKKEEPIPPAPMPLQSIDSQKADSIFNAPGGTINIVQHAKPSEIRESVKADIDSSYSMVEEHEENGEAQNTVFDGLNWEFASSSIIFDGRLRDAFPGLRGIEKIQGEEAVSRLLILLHKPLFVDLNELGGGRISPFWWFRGRSNLHINEFEQLASNRILMDFYEMQIDYIVAVRTFSTEEKKFCLCAGFA